MTVTSPIDGIVRYTLDGTKPTQDSPAYTKPIGLAQKDTAMRKILYDRRIGRHRTTAPVAVLTARLFTTDNKPVNGLGVTRTYWYTGTTAP